MQIELTFLSILGILSIVTSFMLGLLFLTVKSKNKKANIYLGLFLFSLSIEVIGPLSQNFSKELEFIPHTSLFSIIFLFLYVNQTINKRFNKWFLLLFIPGILFNIFPFLDEYYELFFEYFFNISLLLYVIRTLKKHKESVSNFYSDIEHKTLSWIKTIIYIFLGFHLLWIIEDIVGLQNENYLEYFATISTIATFFMIYWIGYNGFSQHEIFKQKLFNTENKTIETNTIIESDLSFEKERKHFEKIKSKILKEKPFTKSDLNLRLLAENLQIKEKELSKLINRCAKTNFYQFINQFRINEFKKLLQSPKANKLSILGLAQEAGFSSKSTFYTAFKTIEGMTPKQYALSLKKSE